VQSPWAITQSSNPRPLANGAFAFQQSDNAAAVWDSYVTVPLVVALPGTATFSLNFTVTGDATFVHNTAGNDPAGPSTIRLLLESATTRWFSVPLLPLQPGQYQLDVNLGIANWQAVDASGTTIGADPAFLSQVTAAGFCFGGGFFACHGVSAATGSSGFQINAASIQ
jgi:hypothetical protein